MLLVALFVAAFGSSGAAMWLALSEPVDASIENRLQHEAAALTRLYGARPLDLAIGLIRNHERRASGFQWRVGTSSGRRIAGNLPDAAYAPGFSTVAAAPSTLREASETSEEAGPPDDDDADSGDRLRTLTVALRNGAMLTLGEDLGRTRALKRLFLRTFMLTSGAALMIALALALTFVSRLLGRIEVIASTADAVSGQDMGARAPLRDPLRADDIDRLALSVNQMLDRIAALLGSLRQVSDDVAHDLRTPLAHLKQRIETVLNAPPSIESYRGALEGASEKIDEVLATFEALLSIARLEAGAKIAGFRSLDLAEVAEAVVEAFRPSAEDGGRQLLLYAPRPMAVEGERSLITQMLANLVENALLHTPPGTTVEVHAENLGAVARLGVEDDGPGLEDSERARIFERFYRGDRSRTTPGSGLGLSLAAAVAAAHNAQIRAEDAGPGLRILVDFPLDGAQAH